MKKNWIRTVLALAGCALLFAGCGESYSAPADTSAVTEEAPAEAGEYAPDDVYLNESAAVSEEEAPAQDRSSELSNELLSNRKLIRNVSMRVETENFDTLISNVNSRILSLGGYAESTDIGRNGYGEGLRHYASVTARIPKDKADFFLDAVSDESNVISRTENVEDVTLQYVDVESRKKALETEEARLLELMEKAENMEDIVAIESRLSEIRYQKESYISQLRTYDNRIDYTTIQLYIEEVKVLTPVEELGAWARIRTGFVRNVENVVRGIRNFAIEFVIAIPYLIAAAVIVLAAVLIVCMVRKTGEKRRQKLAQERRAAAEKKTVQKEERSAKADGGTDEPKL